MNDRDKMLSELRQSSGGIDPVLDQAANYGRGVKAMQSVVRDQGQVMSAALHNNHLLYHTNKKLVAQNSILKADLARLERRFDILSQQNEEQARHIAQLEAAGGDRYKPLYEHAARTLTAFLHDAIPVEQLPAKLAEMKRQSTEIDAMPEKATEDEINEIAPDTLELEPLDEDLTEKTEPLQ